MILYSLKKNSLDEVNLFPFKLEKEIQKIVEDNVKELFNLTFVSSEFRIKNERFDTVCFDEDSKSFVIIEYKKDYSSSIIDQGYSYLSTMLNNQSDLILEFNEKLDKSLKKKDDDWTQPRIIFISPNFNSYQKNSVNFKDLPFELWEIKRFKNNLISFSQIISTSNESIKNIKKSNNVISKVSEKIKSYDTKDLLKKSSEDIKKIWEKISFAINKSDFEATRMINKPLYIRFTNLNNRIIAYFNFRKDHILIHIMGGTVYGDGSKGKYFVDLDDYKNKLKKRIRVWKGYGSKEIYKKNMEVAKDPVHIEYEIKLKDESEISYLIEMLKQRYEAVNI